MLLVTTQLQHKQPTARHLSPKVLFATAPQPRQVRRACSSCSMNTGALSLCVMNVPATAGFLLMLADPQAMFRARVACEGAIRHYLP